MPVDGTPAPGSPGAGLRLVRAERRTFDGPAEFLSDPDNRAAVGVYLSDMIRSYPPELSAPSTSTEALLLAPEQGHSYGEMAETLISAVTSPDEPVDLLVLAFSVHDLQPGRATATYLSHACPGNPMSFAICDQGSAAAYSALRIARDYPASAEGSRSLVIVVEQAALPYGDGTSLPAQHRGVALLLENGPVASGSARDGSAAHGSAAQGSAAQGSAAQGSAAQGSAAQGSAAHGSVAHGSVASESIASGQTARPGPARLVALTQRPNLAAAAVAGQAQADLAELSEGYREVRLVLSQALAAAWPQQLSLQVRVAPADQPSTGIWWQLLDELDALDELDEPGADRPSLLVAADYDPDLRYLCMLAIERG